MTKKPCRLLARARTRQIPRLLAAAAALNAGSLALAHPVIYRNGDGAWFNWVQRVDTPCSDEPLQRALDISQPPTQPGEQTPLSVTGSISCSLSGCTPEHSVITSSIASRIAADPQLWIVECCSRYELVGAPAIGYGSLIGPELRWESSVHTGFSCAFGERYA